MRHGAARSPPLATADECVACTVTTRAKEFGSQLDIPGPGSYDNATDQRASGYLGDAPCYSMGARKAVPKPDDASPGPVYSPRILTPGSTGPIGDAAQYSFGSSKRFEPGTSKDPGPGQYEQSSTRVGGSLIGDAAKYGFGTSSQRPAGDLARGQRCAHTARLASPTALPASPPNGLSTLALAHNPHQVHLQGAF